VDVTMLQWSDPPPLNRPVLLVAFRGLFDAAQAATDAVGWLRDRTPSQQVAAIDPEEFFNFQEARPLVRFDAEGNRVVEWPSNVIWASHPEAGRDLLLLSGEEPHLRWGTFADLLLDVVRRTGTEMVVTVGSMVGMVPHTRPFAVTGSAAHPELARRLGLGRPTYQGPTGVVGVIHDRLDRSGVPVISLRVSVPHYVPGPPNPKATRALLRRLQQTLGATTGYEDLDPAVTEWQARVDQAVQSDDESRDYVRRLEQQFDSDEDRLPSGDDLAAELEAFLREQRRGDD
jgi:proteasome assembly chaperone (PAC2) family protein